MKKFFLPIAFFGVAFYGYAQEVQDTVEVQEEIIEVQDESVVGKPYDRWSVEINGGVNKPTKPFSEGYFTSTPSFFHVDLGVRYMFNPKFGLKLSGGFDQLKSSDESKEFKTNFYRVSLEGVANLGRIMEFEDWTNTFGLLFHAGAGISGLRDEKLNNDTSGLFDKTDDSGHFIVGLTPQVRLSNSIVLTGDISMINTTKQSVTWDAGTSGAHEGRGFDGTLWNGSLGLTFYIGGHEKHADWYSDKGELEKRVDNIEDMLKDDDNDGVPNYLDQEPNSAEGAVVDTKGRTIDSNGNGVPDVIEQYIADNYPGAGTSGVLSDSNILRQLIDSGIINVYFDYDKSDPFDASVGGIDFVVEYLKMNPNASVDIFGYADPVGGSTYNQALSQRRADAVKQIIIGKGIDGSRLNAIGQGIDSDFQGSAVSAHQLARRVIFKIK